MLVQARSVAEGIVATVELMAQSGLPCFGRGAPVANLRARLHLEMSQRQAATHMRQVAYRPIDRPSDRPSDLQSGGLAGWLTDMTDMTD